MNAHLVVEFLDIFMCLWRYYINYKLMKKKVKQYVERIEVSSENREYVLKDFSSILDKQVQNWHDKELAIIKL